MRRARSRQSWRGRPVGAAARSGGIALERWLGAALDYIPRWLDHQMRLSEQPGYSIAVVHRGRLVLEAARGHADLGRGLPLTARHRFRVASHSKTFTAAAVLKLREEGRLGLDDRIARYVDGLHPAVGRATIAQLLSHGAGLVRDGSDTGHWQDRRAFLDARGVRAGLRDGPTIEPNSLPSSPSRLALSSSFRLATSSGVYSRESAYQHRPAAPAMCSSRTCGGK